MMGKRSRDFGDGSQSDEHDDLTARATKRSRPAKPDHFSALSDELILRILSWLSVPDLAVCLRLSDKLRILASDGQLWKALYYNRFVRPRASRLPGIRDANDISGRLHFASKASRWLEDEHLVERGARTNWKRQYRLRNNWVNGSCAVNEIRVAEQPAVPPLLVQMHDSVIYTADQAEGLRAWSAKGEQKMLAQISLTNASPPTALAIDCTSATDEPRLAVGFEDGAYSVFNLNPANSALVHKYTHEASSNGVIAATAVAWPYVVTMTATQLLSLYKFDTKQAKQAQAASPPQLLHSLKSQTVWPPLSISLRLLGTSVLISIAYALPTYLSGWTVGIQEVKISTDGELLNSRLASAIGQHYRPLAFSSHPMIHHLSGPNIGSLATSTTLEMRHIHSKPTSLSYTHPYLLVSHPDNTLALYLVTSTAEALSISAGSRLWGHTSSVSGAQVGGRGRAVSVSRRGDELRVWELEGGFASASARKRLADGDLSVQVRPGVRPSPVESSSQAGLDLVTKAGEKVSEGLDSTELTLTRGWIGFDEENVVVLKEQSQGKQALVIYDFT